MISLALEHLKSNLPNETHLSRIAVVTASARGGPGVGDLESRPLGICNNGVLNEHQAACSSAASSRVSGEDTHTLEYYSATKGKEVLIHATIWVNLANFMLSERNQTQKGHTI